MGLERTESSRCAERVRFQQFHTAPGGVADWVPEYPHRQGGRDWGVTC
jgi:hypothetical protein